MFRADISVSRDDGDVTSQPSAGSYQSQAAAAATLRSLGAYMRRLTTHTQRTTCYRRPARWLQPVNTVDRRVHGDDPLQTFNP